MAEGNTALEDGGGFEELTTADLVGRGRIIGIHLRRNRGAEMDYEGRLLIALSNRLMNSAVDEIERRCTEVEGAAAEADGPTESPSDAHSTAVRRLRFLWAMGHKMAASFGGSIESYDHWSKLPQTVELAAAALAQAVAAGDDRSYGWLDRAIQAERVVEWMAANPTMTKRLQAGE